VSTSYLPYALDPDRVWRVWGSNDLALLARMRSEGEEILEDLFDDQPAKAPGWEAALAAFIAGEPPHQAWVGQNLLVISALVQVLGEELPGRGWEQTSADFVQEVADVVAIDLWPLLSSHCPASIPTRNPYHVDGTALGYLDVAAVAALAPAIAAVKAPDGTDRDVVAAIVDLRRWFRTAARQRTGLFCLQG
jgi:hypothetical protein